MKALVVYYSMSGNAKMIAKAVGKDLGADTLALYPVKTYPDKGFKKYFWGGKSAVMGQKPKLQPYIFDAEKYDTIIFGSPVWASSFAPPLRTFIEDNRAALENKRFAAYVCYMGSGDQKALAKLKKLLGTESLAAELSLIEPKDGKESETAVKIKSFCEKLQAESE